MTTTTGAALLVKCLEQHGVRWVFGIPGAKIDAVFDALTDTSIELVLCRHEQNAAFMAAAVGRLTGEPGVVLVTSGPGVTNLTTGLLTATTEGDAVVALGGNVPREMKLKQSHQSLDNAKLLEAVTKSSVEVSMANTIPEVIANAFRAAKSPQSGATFVSMPQDICLSTVSLETLPDTPLIEYGCAPEALLNQAVAMCQEAKQLTVLLGLEASRPENADAIRRLLSRVRLPIVGTYQAAGVVPREFVDCFVGRVGLFKNQPGDVLLDASDVILAIGFNPVEYDPEIWNADQTRKIIHVNYAPCNIRFGYAPAVEVLGDIRINLEAMTPGLASCAGKANTKTISALQKTLFDEIESGADKSEFPIHPLRFIYELRHHLDDDALVVCDVGSHYMWMARYFLSYQPHHLLFSNGQQTLGVALPWAIAASLIYPGKKIVSICGDGGFLFSGMELETAVRLKSKFIQFIWQDGAYNMVEEQAVMKYGRSHGVRFGPVDYIAYANSMGATGFVLENPQDIGRIVKAADDIDGPVLVGVPIDYRDNPQLFAQVRKEIGH